MTAEEKALKVKTAGKFKKNYNNLFCFLVEINATTRWLADSAFTTYFGKPAFHAYGKGNVKPLNPAHKLLTHNINAATGRQKAQFQQVYDSALTKGLTKTQGVRVPKIPRQKEKLDVETRMQGAELLPKTLKEQRAELGTDVVAIKIAKPKLTVNGFMVDREAAAAAAAKASDKQSSSTAHRKSVSRNSRADHESQSRASRVSRGYPENKENSNSNIYAEGQPEPSLPGEYQEEYSG